MPAERADQAGADDSCGRAIDQDRHHELSQRACRAGLDARSLRGNRRARTECKARCDHEARYPQSAGIRHDHLLHSLDQKIRSSLTAGFGSA